MVGLAYAIVQGPLSNIGWMRAARRELELSEMLGTDGAEGEARRILRERAACRVLRSRDLSESISCGSVRVMCAIALGGLVATGVLGLVVGAMNLLGITSALAVALYVVAIVAMGVGSIGFTVAQSLRRRRIERQRMVRNAK